MATPVIAATVVVSGAAAAGAYYALKHQTPVSNAKERQMHLRIRSGPGSLQGHALRRAHEPLSGEQRVYTIPCQLHPCLGLNSRTTHEVTVL